MKTTNPRNQSETYMNRQQRFLRQLEIDNVDPKQPYDYVDGKFVQRSQQDKDKKTELTLNKIEVQVTTDTVSEDLEEKIVEAVLDSKEQENSLDKKKKVVKNKTTS